MRNSLKREIVGLFEDNFKKVEELNTKSYSFDAVYKVNNSFVFFVSDEIKRETIQAVLNDLIELKQTSQLKFSKCLFIGETEEEYDKGELTFKSSHMCVNCILFKGDERIFVSKGFSLLKGFGLDGITSAIVTKYNYIDIINC